jgi:SET domain-containing protein
LTTRIEIRDSEIDGLGVFAKEVFFKGEVIGIITGTIPEKVDEHSSYAVGFQDEDENAYWVEPFAPWKYLNHSKDANAVGDTPVLIAARNIEVGEEITIYYGDEWEED